MHIVGDELNSFSITRLDYLKMLCWDNQMILEKMPMLCKKPDSFFKKKKKIRQVNRY